MFDAVLALPVVHKEPNIGYIRDTFFLLFLERIQPIMSSSKKRKVDYESRVFQEKWTNDYFFIQIKAKPTCLLCSESVSVVKEYNVKRHYISKHSSLYDSFQGERRKQKVEKLIKELKEQQTIFVKKRDDADNIIRASYIVSEKIAKHSKSYSDGEFVKECLQAVVDILCPGRKKRN